MRTETERFDDIVKHPDQHRHNYDQLLECCLLDNGSLSLFLLDAHAEHASVGTNGGVRCDTTEGPCSCGAWH